MSTKKLVWLDLETTGLDPNFGQVMSLGMRITDESLKPVAPDVEWDCKLHSDREEKTVWVPGKSKSYRLEPIVWDMHTKSGLLARCENAPFTWDEIRVLTRQHLLTYVGKGPATLAGSSIHFDERWIRKHAVELLSFFHYRMLDVSVFKVIAETWAPGLAKPSSGAPAHTPLKDIEDSIQTLRYYRMAMLKDGVIP